MDTYKIIKKRCLELGLTLKDVAKALGVAESTVSRYESLDIQNMGIDKIEALAKVLKCSPAYLMGWENTIQEDGHFHLSDLEKQIVIAFRQADEISKAMVLRALSIDEAISIKGDEQKNGINYQRSNGSNIIHIRFQK